MGKLKKKKARGWEGGGDWQVQGGGHMQMKHLNVFGSPQAGKQRDLGPRLLKEDAARTHIPSLLPLQHTSSIPGISPFQLV